MDKYNDLENLYGGLKVLINGTNLIYYKGLLQDILDDVENDMEELKEKISKEYQAEKQEKENEYRKMQGF